MDISLKEYVTNNKNNNNNPIEFVIDVINIPISDTENIEYIIQWPLVIIQK